MAQEVASDNDEAVTSIDLSPEDLEEMFGKQNDTNQDDDISEYLV